MNALKTERTEFLSGIHLTQLRRSNPLRPVTLKHIQCKDPGHRPPPMTVYESGHYDHECPSCGSISAFMIKNAD